MAEKKAQSVTPGATAKAAPVKAEASKKATAIEATAKKAAPGKATPSEKATPPKKPVAKKPVTKKAAAAKAATAKAAEPGKAAEQKKARQAKTPAAKAPAAKASTTKASAAKAAASKAPAAKKKKAAPKTTKGASTAPPETSVAPETPPDLPLPIAEIELAPDYEPSPHEEYMNPLQLAYFRRKLLDWRDSLLRESQQTIDHLRSDGASRYVGDEADRARDESEVALELRTRDRYRKLLPKIEAALRRIDDGSYGFCEETGEPIGLKRLEARPIAMLSVEAQELREKSQRGYRDDG